LRAGAVPPAPGRKRATSVAGGRRASNATGTLGASSALLRIVGESRLGARALGQLASELAAALDAPALTIRLLDQTGRWLDLEAAVGLSKHMRTRIRRVPVESLVGNEVVRRQRRMVLSGNPDAPLLRRWPGSLIRRFGTGTFVPIRAGRQVIGVMGVGFRHLTRPPAAQLSFLEAVGRQLGAALRTVEMRETRRKSRSETRFLRRIADALSANLDLTAVLDMVTVAAARLTRARGALVMLLSRDGTEFEIASTNRLDDATDIRGLRFPVAGSLSEIAIRTGRSVRCRDAATDRRPLLRRLRETDDVRGLMIVPLRGDGGVIGTLNVSSKRPRVFTDHDRRTLMQLGYQASIAIRNARMFEELRDQRQMLRQLYSQQYSVLEGERKRIAHELHDEMGPTLSAILINLQLLKERGAEVMLGAKVAETETLLTGIIEKIRELAYGLRPPMLEHLGLAESLKWMIETYFTGGRLAVDYRVSGPPVRLDPDLALAIYRIAQEALTNVVKHARATRVQVRLALSAASVRLDVHDDGCGFDAARVASERRVGLGLASMRERMDHLHGRLELRSRPGKGSQLTVTCPLESVDARAAG
jgi:signal transduction histidine kinase